MAKVNNGFMIRERPMLFRPRCGGNPQAAPHTIKSSSKSFDKTEVFAKLNATLDGVVAQLVEHHNGIVGVAGSIPVGSTILQHLNSLASLPLLAGGGNQTGANPQK